MMVKNKLQLLLLLHALRGEIQGLNDGQPDQSSPNAITISFSIAITLLFFIFFGGGSGGHVLWSLVYEKH